ncbi:MAG: methyltransferase type 12, partial [Dehalococcoidia bacterium]|nr:methyltransferase type 12 [Dehalococcoidia bacterium]MCA9854211.1 methyltransferase type 12 [Dehalococcoidia bacterium]
MTAAGNLYDSHPYPRLSYVHTTPDRMATVATLLGLEAPPIERCRVLEVGSAIGGNLIPMAMRMPDSTFLGIDLSAN